MMENKEKVVTSGDEDIQVQDDTTASIVQKSAIQTRKRKTVSSLVSLGDLPSRRGSKKQKPIKNPLPNVPKFTPPTVDLDNPVINMVPIQTIPPV